MIFNIFCDASINTEMRIACGGCYITCQTNDVNQELSKRLIIQHNATNNSAEILAIYCGIEEALKIRKQYPSAVFSLFSDSKISIYGLRDWIQNWIANAKDGILVSSSGQPVMNQQRFIIIYNLIVRNKLYIELYHQRGHVTERISLDQARAQFIRANRRTPESLGVDIEYLSKCNIAIDNATRKALNNYIISGDLSEDTELDGIYPIEFNIESNLLYQYNRYIRKK